MGLFVSSYVGDREYESNWGTGHIHKLHSQARGRSLFSGEGGRGSPKFQRYYISLCCKFVNQDGGVKNPQNLVNVVYGYPLGELWVRKWTFDGNLRFWKYVLKAISRMKFPK